MKKMLIRILMMALGFFFLAAVIRILFILDLGSRKDQETSGWESLEEQRTSEGETKRAGEEGETKRAGEEGKTKRAEEEDKTKQAEEQESFYDRSDQPEETQPIFAEQKKESEPEPTLGQDEEAVSLPEEKGPPVLYIASDLHYQSASSTDYGKAYKKLVRESDGKLITYLPQLLDAFIDEMIQAQPDAFLLTGDITMNGERMNHLELAEKLARLSDAGVQVLIIPGNHDIHNSQAGVYFGDEKAATDSVSLEEFRAIYQEFGWNQAISRDSASFSYLYPLDEKVWLMLLDTAQYDPINQVEGAVREETLAWMEENLKKAKEEGVQVMVSGHHNLLPESRLFTTQCVLENSDALLKLLEENQLPLYISGHLHLQRIQKHQTEPGEKGYGIYEIVSSAVSIPPCQYGILSWQEEGAITYAVHSVDVSGWASQTGQEDENLLDFESYERKYVKELIQSQILEKIHQMPELMAEQMAEFYAETYANYCAGRSIDLSEAMRTEAYQCWLRFMSQHETFQELEAMLKDSRIPHNHLFLPP